MTEILLSRHKCWQEDHPKVDANSAFILTRTGLAIRQRSTEHLWQSLKFCFSVKGIISVLD